MVYVCMYVPPAKHMNVAIIRDEATRAAVLTSSAETIHSEAGTVHTATTIVPMSARAILAVLHATRQPIINKDERNGSQPATSPPSQTIASSYYSIATT